MKNTGLESASSVKYIAQVHAIKEEHKNQVHFS